MKSGKDEGEGHEKARERSEVKSQKSKSVEKERWMEAAQWECMKQDVCIRCTDYAVVKGPRSIGGIDIKCMNKKAKDAA